MNTQTIFAIALRFLGFQLGIRAIEKFTRILLIKTTVLPKEITLEYTLKELSSPFIGPIQVFLFVFYSACCWYLLSHADQLSKKWLHDPKDTSLTKDRLFELVFLYQGLNLLIFGLSSLCIRIFQQSFISETIGTLTGSLFTQFSSALYIVEILIGILILFRARRISNWLTEIIPDKFWK